MVYRNIANDRFREVCALSDKHWQGESLFSAPFIIYYDVCSSLFSIQFQFVRPQHNTQKEEGSVCFSHKLIPTYSPTY